LHAPSRALDRVSARPSPRLRAVERES